MFKSKIEVRRFAIEQAVIIMGTGTPQKDIISKAREIETYVIGEAELPEISNEEEMVMGLAGNIASLFHGISGEHCSCHAPAPVPDLDLEPKEEKSSKKK